ncbi:hypothetical protein QC763_115460 [Podospora pseudopauciseta]|uniref:Uncharacterized protein n=1 Tax=Podospora pseudopauciseta TaxID=2093780 RepID=A0ABR0I0D7_9PEZI|nr:hypothetical protein QC763_115460 [Podospora pseudopauciseta]
MAQCVCRGEDRRPGPKGRCVGCNERINPATRPAWSPLPPVPQQQPLPPPDPLQWPFLQQQPLAPDPLQRQLLQQPPLPPPLPLQWPFLQQQPSVLVTKQWQLLQQQLVPQVPLQRQLLQQQPLPPDPPQDKIAKAMGKVKAYEKAVADKICPCSLPEIECKVKLPLRCTGVIVAQGRTNQVCSYRPCIDACCRRRRRKPTLASAEKPRVLHPCHCLEVIKRGEKCYAEGRCEQTSDRSGWCCPACGPKKPGRNSADCAAKRSSKKLSDRRQIWRPEGSEQ